MIKIIYEQKENRAAAYDDEKFIGESTYAKSDKVWIIDLTFSCNFTYSAIIVTEKPFFVKRGQGFSKKGQGNFNLGRGFSRKSPSQIKN